MQAPITEETYYEQGNNWNVVALIFLYTNFHFICQKLSTYLFSEVYE